MKKLLAVDDTGLRLFWRLYKIYNRTHSEFIKTIVNQRWKRLMIKFGACVPLGASIHPSVEFPHGLHGIFISIGAVIGENTTIFQQVTIGSNTLKDSAGYGAPCIGRNCCIGAGAKIIGDVHVGDNVRIGANCVVVRDVPTHATIVPAYARVIPHEDGRDNRYIAWNQREQKPDQTSEEA